MTNARTSFCVACLALAAIPAHAQIEAIPRHSRILVEAMSEDLDAWVRAEIHEQGLLYVTLDRNDADFVLSAYAPPSADRKWPLAFAPGKKSAPLSISLVTPDGEFVWASEISGGGTFLGVLPRDNKQKVARQIAESLGSIAE